MREVAVELAERSYPIVIGDGALAASADRLRAVIGRGTAVIVADETVWGLHEAAMRRVLPDAPVVTVPSGEATKCWTQFERVSEALLAAGVGRDGTVVAFGGGVTGDLAGFCAATLRRGCRFVQVPTTLLAMVDSSVGGKTAINTSAGKNLVGAFWQPRLVVSDTTLLRTLPEREFRAGVAEVLKIALAIQPPFAEDLGDWFLGAGQKGALDAPERLARVIAAACRLKAEVVAEDEREAGRRALLNLGHTFGHAIEAAYGYDGRVLHGEAVGLGMAMAYRFAAAFPGHTGCSDGDRDRAVRLIASAGLPTRAADLPSAALDTDDFLAAMYQDKKTEGGKLTLILPYRIGGAHVIKGVPEAELRVFLEDELS